MTKSRFDHNKEQQSKPVDRANTGSSRSKTPNSVLEEAAASSDEVAAETAEGQAAKEAAMAQAAEYQRVLNASISPAQVNSAEEGSRLIEALEEYARLLIVQQAGEKVKVDNVAEQLEDTKSLVLRHIVSKDGINAVKDNKTALHLAVEIGDIEIVKDLIHYGADLNIKNKDGNTALHLAVEIGDIEIVQTLVMNGAKIDIVNKEQKTALDFSIEEATASVSSLKIRDMLETSRYRAIDNEIQQIESSINSLQEDELEEVKNDYKLISEYDKILAATEEAKAATKLQAIVRGKKGREKAQEAKAAVAPTSTLQVTTEQPVGSEALLKLSLNTAIELTEDVKLPTQEESREQSKLLLEEGGVKTEGLSDEEIAQKVFQSIPQSLEGNKQQTSSQQTSEDVRRQAAVQKQEGSDSFNDKELQEELSEADSQNLYNAKIKAESETRAVSAGEQAPPVPAEGQAAGQTAQQVQLNVAKLSIEKEADINQTNKDGLTRLYVAAREGQLAVAQLLLDKGAEVNLATNRGATPLYIAAQQGQLDIAQLLLDRGAEVNKAKTNGVTPLLVAAYNGELAVAQLLLDRGADVNQALNDGRTPLLIAAQQGHKTVTLLLKLAGAKRDAIDFETNDEVIKQALKASAMLEIITQRFPESATDLHRAIEETLDSITNIDNLLSFNEGLERKFNKIIHPSSTADISHMVNQFLPGKLPDELIGKIANPEIENLAENDLRGTINTEAIVAQIITNRLQEQAVQAPAQAAETKIQAIVRGGKGREKAQEAKAQTAQNEEPDDSWLFGPVEQIITDHIQEQVAQAPPPAQREAEPPEAPSPSQQSVKPPPAQAGQTAPVGEPPPPAQREAREKAAEGQEAAAMARAESETRAVSAGAQAPPPVPAAAQAATQEAPVGAPAAGVEEQSPPEGAANTIQPRQTAEEQEAAEAKAVADANAARVKAEAAERQAAEQASKEAAEQEASPTKVAANTRPEEELTPPPAQREAEPAEAPPPSQHSVQSGVLSPAQPAAGGQATAPESALAADLEAPPPAPVGAQPPPAQREAELTTLREAAEKPVADANAARRAKAAAKAAREQQAPQPPPQVTTAQPAGVASETAGRQAAGRQAAEQAAKEAADKVLQEKAAKLAELGLEKETDQQQLKQKLHESNKTIQKKENVAPTKKQSNVKQNIFTIFLLASIVLTALALVTGGMAFIAGAIISGTFLLGSASNISEEKVEINEQLSKKSTSKENETTRTRETIIAPELLNCTTFLEKVTSEKGESNRITR